MSTAQVNAPNRGGFNNCRANESLGLHLNLMLRLHMRKTLLFAPPLRVIR
jgi:hypothetical protein